MKSHAFLPCLPLGPLELSWFEPMPRSVFQPSRQFPEPLWVCPPLGDLGSALQLAKPGEECFMDEAGRESPSHHTHGWSTQAPQPGTHPCTCTREPPAHSLPLPPASQGGNASPVSKPLSASPGSLRSPSVSSEAMSGVRAWSSGWASGGACDSGLSQAGAGCQCHSLGHEESHSSIYRQCTAGPAWREAATTASWDQERESRTGCSEALPPTSTCLRGSRTGLALLRQNGQGWGRPAR